MIAGIPQRRANRLLELGQLIGVLDDSELPVLGVVGTWGVKARSQDLLQVVFGKRLVLIGAHAPPCFDGLQCLAHGKNLPGGIASAGCPILWWGRCPETDAETVKCRPGRQIQHSTISAELQGAAPVSVPGLGNRGGEPPRANAIRR